MKAALFDLDGVLVDTESQYTVFWRRIGEAFLPEVPDFALRIKGQTLTNIYNVYFPGQDGLQKEITRRLNAFEQAMEFPFIPGAQTFVAALRAQGIPTAVVTSSNRQKMAALYAAHPGFCDCFDRIFTAEDARRSKPAPDCYLYAAEQLGVAPEECVVFEDSRGGLQAGRASGAKVVALATSIPPTELKEISDIVIDDFQESTPQTFDILFNHTDN